MATLVDLQKLVDTTAQGDKDERWMATNDICNILSSDRVIDEHMEQKICNAVLKQLGKFVREGVATRSSSWGLTLHWCLRCM